MAWPNTPLTTYVDNSAPAISARDLNSIQSAINGIYSATSTLAAVVLDGIGGTTLGPPPSGFATGTTMPTPVTSYGGLYKDTVPFAWAWADGATINKGFNIKSIAISGGSGAGTQFTITMNVSASDSIYCIVGSSNSPSAPNSQIFASAISTNSSFLVSVYTSAGTLVNGPYYSFVVFAS